MDYRPIYGTYVPGPQPLHSGAVSPHPVSWRIVPWFTLGIHLCSSLYLALESINTAGCPLQSVLFRFVRPLSVPTLFWSSYYSDTCFVHS
ncbi:hypothetical protein MVEN_01636300 [Mycena venus]|uniref:Uncharacterized protein n=1 Tax=Mycena venus TaxID=2733690 RepID=A0A8H7CNY1_9AGAR|nr:hypothetical protein MVEN_01636300 [Mycena venus]